MVRRTRRKGYRFLQGLSGNFRHESIGMQKSEYGYNGITCLIYHTPEVLYYDDLIIRASRKKEFRIVGNYTYETRNGSQRTVPVIKLMDKQKKSKKKKKSDDD